LKNEEEEERDIKHTIIIQIIIIIIIKTAKLFKNFSTIKSSKDGIIS